MKKIRLVRTMIVEFVPNAEYYPDGFTIEDMAKMDADSDDRELTFDNCISDKVTWEIIEE